MTAEHIDLEALAALEAAATPGPWVQADPCGEIRGDYERNAFQRPWVADADVVTGDAALIVALRNAAPALIVAARASSRFERFWHDSEAECRAVKERLDAAQAALARVEALHREVHPVFSWNGGLRYDDPCPTCHGAPGVPGDHECGCWADSQIEYVCAECHPGEGSGWPCATIRAITEVRS